MATRGNLSTVQWKTQVTPTGTISTHQAALPTIGLVEDLLDSTQPGSFTPGVFRLNPVTIRKRLGVCTDCDTWFRAQYYTGTIYDYLSWGAGATEFISATVPTLPKVATWQTNLADQALVEAKAKIWDSDADVLLMLAEGADTLRMLRNPFDAMGKFLHQWRTWSLKWKHGVDLSSKEWLKFRYGIMPLISDIESLIALYNAKTSKVGMQRYRRRKTSVSTSSYDMSSNVRKAWHTSIERKYTYSYNMTAIFYTQMMMEIDAKWSPGRYGFDLRQLPAAAWELVPYSFVVDWILGVGTWLRAIMPTIDQKHLGCCVSQKSEITFVVKPTLIAPYLPYRHTLKEICRAEPGRYQFTLTELQRVVNPTVPVMPVLNLNRFKYKQAIDSLALTWGQIPREWKRRLK